MTATVKANSDGSADLLVNAIAAIHMAADGEVSFPQQGQSLAPNGYVELPGGLIIQWGLASPTAGQAAITFPIPFPTAALIGQATPYGTTSGNTNSFTAYISTLNAADIVCNVTYVNSGGVVGPANQQVFWIAIGF